MLATELISKLTELVQAHGDLSVMNEYGNCLDDPEFNDDDGPCILVSFEEE